MTASVRHLQVVPDISERRGVLLVNVGTPDAPNAREVRKFLAEFLGDPYVIDLSPVKRWILLNLIILPLRPRRSAHAYQQIWTEQGSPMLLHSNAQRDALAKLLPNAEVELGMRYGNPSMYDAVARLRSRGVTHITLVPLYPQFAEATTGTTLTAFERIFSAAPDRVVRPFYLSRGFVAAAAKRVAETVSASKAEHVLFSYHGLPIRQVAKVCHSACHGLSKSSEACPDISAANERCYRAQCYATSKAIAASASLSKHSTAFQSRIKGTTWLSPHTVDVLRSLAEQGVRRLAVACPSFVADCLETLEEIGMRAAETFRAHGGEQLTLVPAVNDQPVFMEALAELIREGWAEQSARIGADV